MAREKFSVGDRVEVQCENTSTGQRSIGWIPGTVIEADYRMVAVKFDCDVFSSNGWRIPDRILWLAHGSRNIRSAAK